MKPLLYLLPLALLVSCSNSDPAEKTQENSNPGNYVATEITEQNTTPTVAIGQYTLLSNSRDDRKGDAAEIMRVKRSWPLAMQSQSKAAFDSILSPAFVFIGERRLLNRTEYITDRTAPSEWKITHVEYSNMTLQFFGDRALLTYRNVVTNEHRKTRAIESEHMSWVDVYKKEQDQWKLDAAHVIDYRVEKE